MPFYETIQSNPLRRDTHDLAVEMATLMRSIQSTSREFDITRQLIRSTISIGANLAESQGSASNEMVTAKLEISYREACESRFHLSVLTHMGLVPKETSELLDKKLDSIGARLYSGIRRLRASRKETDPHSRF